jgi:large subunit ribosomal protein L3
MTRIVKGDKLVPVTLIKIPELKVAQVKTIENDGYEAVVLEIVGTDTLREVSITGALKDVKKGDTISLDILDGVENVKIVSISK